MSALPVGFQFEPQPHAAAWLATCLAAARAASPRLAELERRFAVETTTRLADFVERLTVTERPSVLQALGFSERRPGLWLHTGGLFPTVERSRERTQVSLRVDDVAAFALRHGLSGPIDGAPLAPYRKLLVFDEGGVQTWVVERNAGRLDDDGEQPHPERVLRHTDAFRTRARNFEREGEGFDQALVLAAAATADLGPAYASNLFFRAEREYWESRNEAGALQKRRQDRLGLGWGNHDHHTYRSSREHFRALVGVLEALGMQCRERFYAGAEAGWGAQVMEHPDTSAMVFADVDLSPDEVRFDFAHLGLEPRSRLGTVGLWCALHGEALLQAGMHHLEGQFAFAETVAWFEQQGGTMPPFTYFPHLKQCFTLGQRWPVSVPRLRRALADGHVSPAQAEAFLLDGAIGSHLEILERNDGFKGFNQKGISEIITATDPRKVAAE